ITGVNGFIAGHVVEQLLGRGYRVRGCVAPRGAKYRTLVDTIKKPGLDFVQIDDVATGNFTEALKGVDAVLHTACPLAGRKGLDDTFFTAIEGTLNVVQQAQKVGIKKIIATSSFGALISPSFEKVFGGFNIDESDWNDVTEDEFEKNKENPYYIYFCAKSKMERALLDFGKEHPDIDIITIVPGYVHGPYARTFPLPTSASTLGTNETIYELLQGKPAPPAPNWLVDVRDVAKGHILALEAPDLPADKRRFIVNAGTYTWKLAAEYLFKSREVLRNRLIPIEDIPPLPAPSSNLDNTRAREYLGLDSYISHEKMFDDAVDDLLMLEKMWATSSQNLN
ncbi:NAD(P)-binding protein, partial [Pholiota conissans]